MSYNSLTFTDAARVSRWASIGGDNANDAWGSANGSWSGTAAYAAGPTAVAGKAFSFDGASKIADRDFFNTLGSTEGVTL